MMVCSLLELKANELLPEIEKLYRQDLADRMCAGSWKEVKRVMLRRINIRPLTLDIDEKCKDMEKAFEYNCLW